MFEDDGRPLHEHENYNRLGEGGLNPHVLEVLNVYESGDLDFETPESVLNWRKWSLLRGVEVPEQNKHGGRAIASDLTVEGVVRGLNEIRFVRRGVMSEQDQDFGTPIRMNKIACALQRETNEWATALDFGPRVKNQSCGRGFSADKIREFCA